MHGGCVRTFTDAPPAEWYIYDLATKQATAVQTPSTTLPATEKDNAPHPERKIWLAKSLYETVPYFYVIAGLLTLFGTAYITKWYWGTPIHIASSVICVLAGVVLWRRRKDYRKSLAQLDAQDRDEARPPPEEPPLN